MTQQTNNEGRTARPYLTRLPEETYNWLAAYAQREHISINVAVQRGLAMLEAADREDARRYGDRPMIYSTPAMPEHWVALANDGLAYLFPAIAGGWAQRRPYAPGRAALAHMDRLGGVEARTVAAASGGAFSIQAALDAIWIEMD